MTGGPEDFEPYPEAKSGPVHDRDRHKLAAVAIRGAAQLAPRELDAADLTVAGGDVVQIICLADVMDWLYGLATRVENGQALP